MKECNATLKEVLISRQWPNHIVSSLYLYLKETVEEFQKLFVENEVLKDSVTGLQQQYRSTAESNEVSRIFGYLVAEHKALT